MANPQSAIRNPQSAMTLVELLVTMSVVAILMLGGVGVYWRMNRGLALSSAVSSIESVLRSARACAVHERSPAVVAVGFQPDSTDPDPRKRLVGVVHALGRETVSCWHFEQEQFAGGSVLGALGQKATATGATPAPGKVGMALLLDGATTQLEVQSPYLDGVREGVFIECYVCPQAAADGALLPIVSKGEGAAATYWLALLGVGGNAFALQGNVCLAGGVVPSTLTTGALVVPGQWSHVALAYYRDGKAQSGSERGTLTLSVNGVEAGRSYYEGADPRLEANTAPLRIGFDGANRFKGMIDELKIAGLVAGEAVNLPKNTEVRLDPGGSPDGRVHFDPEGKLDPAHHKGPAIFRVISAEDRLLRSVRVNWLGTVEVFDGEPQAEQ